MWNVVKYSLLENLRNKFYLASLGMIVFIVWLSHYSSQINFNYGNYTLAILTLGMYFTKLITFAFIVFLPVINLSQEIENGTVYILLSKKIERPRYLIAKYIAFMILYTTLVLTASLSLWLITFLIAEDKSQVGFKILYFVYSQILSGGMILSIVFLLYTAIRAPIVTAVISAMTYFLSLMLDSAKEISDKAPSAFIKYFYLFLYFIFPNFRYFSLEKNIVYNKPVDVNYLIVLLAYAGLFSIICLIASSAVFSKREL
jgi:ABC-type transport system involved in multi-copper enzyme maturation permease subunit